MIDYNIGPFDVGVSLVGGLSGLPYTLRHFAAAKETQTRVWEHRILGFIEAFPVLGLVVAVIEAIACSYFFVSEPKKADAGASSKINIAEVREYLDNHKVTILELPNGGEQTEVEEEISFEDD